MNRTCRGIMEYQIGKMMGARVSQSPHFLLLSLWLVTGLGPRLSWIIPRALILSSAPVTKSTIPAGPSHQSGTSVISVDLFIFTELPPLHRATNGHDPSPATRPPPPQPSQQPPNLITYFGFSSQEPQWQKSKNTKSTVSLTSSGRRRVNRKYISYSISI